MLRMVLWYLVGTACVLGLLVAMGTMSLATLFVLRHHLLWNLFPQPMPLGLG
ncbi:MAG: hypothetical protein MAG451_01789 [Anaerolineales bacterium]|nr:hypothetical protein [Anaerolineales bacterium]